ncbi:MAG: hypothetical protein QXK42_06095, partial [Candidatus Korarchaeum sp.]
MSARFFLILSVLLLLVPLLPAPATHHAATYYVAPWGDDSNPGTRERPWKSPGLATRRIGPGDTLVIMGGRY